MPTVLNSRKEIKMKLHWIVALSLLIGAGIVKGQATQEASPLKDQKDKVSYSLGLNIGNNLKKQAIDVNPDLLVRGIKDSFSNAKPLLTEAQVEEVLTAFKKDMAAKQQQEIAAMSEK